MRNVKFNFQSEIEKKRLESEYLRMPITERQRSTPIMELLEEMHNTTLYILVQVKNNTKWKDPEKVINFVGIIRKIREERLSPNINLEDSEVKLVIDSMDELIKEGVVVGAAIEKFIDVRDTFFNAEKVETKGINSKK